MFRSTKVLDAVTLEQLHTFMHPDSVDGRPSFSPDGRSLIWINRDSGFAAWDLQTGGRISAAPSALYMPAVSYLSSTHSVDGKIVAFASAYRGWENYDAATSISTYNLISGTHIYSHHPLERHVIAPIWTHGEFLRFATVEPGLITIWEVGFTSEHTLAEIESLPAPGDAVPGDADPKDYLFLPTLSRLAFLLKEAILIWDARDSKFLLNFVGGAQPKGLSFSSNGRFFACGSKICQEVHLWKESPTGYVLHRKLVAGPVDHWITPFLSPDGESIITSKGDGIQLWRTTDSANPPSSVPPQPAKQTDFVLAFSPDKSFIATGRSGGKIATIADLKSGDPRLIVDTGMKIWGLGVTMDAVVVVGEGNIITWNLPVGDCFRDARANIHDSVRTILFNHPPPLHGRTHYASISPDFNHLVITREESSGLEIYDVSTGKHLVGTAAGFVAKPWFTRDGCEVRHSRFPFFRGGKKIIRGGRSDVIGLEPVGDDDDPSGGHLWESSHGHNVTDDGWVLDSRKKRVMWLPHHWRFSKEDRIWDGQFLALFDRILPEPVIIEDRKSVV